ncbi:hypothetical protein AAHA92_03215 [Salvia divinorum]|uniref:Uncharacterized protein n=1 Tax=Salvia divinorum TaxID=28513 RepID=A0ABD1IGC6_SALDI
MEKILPMSRVPEVHDKYRQSPILQRKLNEVSLGRNEPLQIGSLPPPRIQELSLYDFRNAGGVKEVEPKGD